MELMLLISTFTNEINLILTPAPSQFKIIKIASISLTKKS